MRRVGGDPRLAELDELERAGKLTMPQAVYRSWQRLFLRLKPELAQ